MSGIVHKGIIRKSGDGSTHVELLDAVNCESCSAKGGCQLGEGRDNIINVNETNEIYRDGELVEVVLSMNMAFGAMFWAYIFPFMVLLVGLIVLSQYLSEGAAGLIALSFLVFYYLLVYLNKNYFDKKFQLKINRYD